MYATIELRDLILHCDLGTYGPGDVVPEAHVLDLTLTIGTDRVLIARDGMDQVFDYDPLIRDIDRLARDGHYETQERLISRIAEACAAYSEITAASLCLRKTPVLNASGSLGVRLDIDTQSLSCMRPRAA
ncbi:dihydroneopterin aldolase [Shimia ponticola]|uniref:dihydroneopterin aldolase n=1 Tax=Shimia ponticola TaxID=2582893 RepID=UPI0011BFD5C3|nr:dihydroneopterin aldolase [Shimia ponticola]